MGFKLGSGAVAALLQLAACTGNVEAPSAPPAQDLPNLELDTPSGALVWRGLEHLADARYALPTDAESPPSDGTFSLTGPWTSSDRTVGRLHDYSQPLPFHTNMPRPNYAPLGALFYRGTQRLPYVNDPEDLRGGGWFVEAGALHVLALERPDTWRDTPRLEVAELAATENRRRWTGEGVAADFVRTQVTAGAVTSPGIQIVPGGEITFPLDVPADAALDLGIAAYDPLLPQDGTAAVELRWRIGADELGRGSAAPGVAPSQQRSSLARWAGQRVELTFSAPSTNGTNVVVTAPTVSRRPERAPRRVVWVGVDTLRQDVLGAYGYPLATSPELDAWAAQSVVFDAAWAPAPRTRPSFRTALTGRYPLAATSAPTVAEALDAAGFRTAGVVANVHLVPRFSFSDGFEYWEYENGARADVQVDRALAWLHQHEEEDTFLFLHIMDPHTFYNAPEPYGSRFQQGAPPPGLPEFFDRWHIYQLMESRGFGDAQKRWIRAAYDGEVAYTSAMLGRLFSEVDKLPGRTVTVLHSDHGEEFWDHDAYEHNHSLYEELVRAVLWIRPPGGRSEVARVASAVGLVDLVSTLLDLVGAPPIESDGRSLAAFVDPARESEREALAAELAERPLQLGHLMFGKERWGVVYQGWKYILHTGTGQEELYDLAADRGEHDDRAAAQPERLAPMRAALAVATGWPVAPGWRVRFEGPRIPVDFTFDAPVAAAGVIDPEAQRTARANLEWGEPPAVTVEEVGAMFVSPDRRSVRYVPGRRASGHTVWVSCDGPCPPGQVRVGERTAPLGEGPLAFGPVTLAFAAGTLIDVPVVAEDLAAPESGQLDALEQLGYLEPD